MGCLLKQSFTIEVQQILNASNSPDDSLALAKLYESTEGENWINRTNWMDFF